MYMERWTFTSQLTDVPANGRPDNLYAPVADDGGERGRNWNGHTRQTSVYSRAFLHPRTTLFAMLAVTLAVAIRALPSANMRRARQFAGGP